MSKSLLSFLGLGCGVAAGFNVISVPTSLLLMVVIVLLWHGVNDGA